MLGLMLLAIFSIPACCYGLIPTITIPDDQLKPVRRGYATLDGNGNVVLSDQMSPQSAQHAENQLGTCRSMYFPDVLGFKDCLEGRGGLDGLNYCRDTMDPMKLENDVLECTLEVIRSLGNSGSTLYLIKGYVTEACNRLGCGDLVNETYELCNGGAKNQPLGDCTKMHVDEREACGRPFVIKVPGSPKIAKCPKPSVFKCEYSKQRTVQLLDEFSRAITCRYTSMADSYPKESSTRLSCTAFNLLRAILDINQRGRSALLDKFRDFHETSCKSDGSA